MYPGGAGGKVLPFQIVGHEVNQKCASLNDLSALTHTFQFR